MGLFGKKEKVNFVLVGKNDSRVSISDSQISILKDVVIPQIIRKRLGGDAFVNNRTRVLLFDEWTNRCYSANVLGELERNGFTISNSPDLENIYNDINKALVTKYFCTMDTTHPTVQTFRSDDRFAGLFLLCFENKVNSKYLVI